MVVPLMSATISLSIFLLRIGKEKDYDRDIGDDRSARLPLTSPLEGYFSAIPGEVRRPSWTASLGPLVATPGTIDLESQSPGGLLVVVRGTRTFVLTFGHAWMKLRNDWLEPDYGRRVALNLMNASSLIELRTEQVFARWHLASERAPRGSSIDNFGVQFDRDMVSVVEGISSSSFFGRTIRGGTSLRVSATPSRLGDLLDRSLVEFASTAYKKRWPNIDNLTEVGDAATITVLDKQLDADLASGKGVKKVTMFTPSQHRGEALTASYYVIGRAYKNAAVAPYLTFGMWENHATKQNMPLTVSTAKTTPIHLLDDDKKELGDCSVFDCFGYEASLAGRPHILSSGNWYEVVPSFLKRINRTVGQIPAATKRLPNWTPPEHEEAYNARCAASDKSLLHFDRVITWYGGGQGKVEFCDLMHLRSRRLYFVKEASRASGLSHLIEQCRRTVELFFNPDPGFRDALRTKIKELNPSADTSWTTKRPSQGEWKLCFVGMGRSAGQLPFFARCSLANAYNDLRVAGHVVEFLSV